MHDPGFVRLGKLLIEEDDALFQLSSELFRARPCVVARGPARVDFHDDFDSL